MATRLLPGGGAEQDPGAWWTAIVRPPGGPWTARSRPSAVVGVGCTAQWSGTVAVDGDGTPLRAAVIWMDSRGCGPDAAPDAGTAQRPRLRRAQAPTLDPAHRRGPGHSGKDPTAHILWIRHAEPDVYRATYKFLEPVDWLNQRLTGRFAASYDSIAAHWVTDNRRIASVAYDDTLLRMSGLERSKLPDLVPPATVMGSLRTDAAEELGLPAGIPVVTGTGDVHSAAVGSGAVADFAGHLYIGTSSWISCHVPFKKTDALRNVASIPAAVPGRYLVADEHETAGACLTFLARNLLFDDGRARVRAVAGTATSTAASTRWRRRWRRGRRGPVHAVAERRALTGGRPHHPGRVPQPVAVHVPRTTWCAPSTRGWRSTAAGCSGAVERFVGRRFDALAFVGGGANSDVWAQIHADVTGRRIRQVADPVLANVRGAGLLALLALGRIGVDDIPAMVRGGPDLRARLGAAPVYDELYREFVNLYKQTKQIHRRLNRH